MNKKILAVIILPLLSIAAAGAWVMSGQDSGVDNLSQKTVDDFTQQLSDEVAEERYIKAYYESDLPGVEKLDTPPSITGDSDADARIRALAERRGHRLQSVATSDLVNVNDVEVQPLLAKAWSDLRATAAKDGIDIELVGGYVSVEEQRQIFLAELRRRAEGRIGREYTSAQIAGGTADAVINSILRRHAIPGYSKHHSGYVVDFMDAGSGAPEEFLNSDAYEWARQDDYLNIKQFGFLPSHPESGPNQGPEVREWEFVWVGVDNIGFGK
jgi:LAS superfamily LD-carboxypeptidase LdcB